MTTTSDWLNVTGVVDERTARILSFEAVIRVVVPVVFSVIAVLGFVGNLSVIIVVVANLQMRSTTNTLILSLAVADLLFIVICVPFTAVSYAITVWPFGTAWCKIYQFTIHVTAYVSVYTLVLMSLDRYLAVVHPIRSLTLRTQRNAMIAVVTATIVICILNAPTLPDYGLLWHEYGGEDRIACINLRLLTEETHYGCVFYGSFFAFGYAIPLSLVCVLYGMMLHRLRNRKAPSTSTASAAASTARTTATSPCGRKSKRATADDDATTPKSRRSSSKRRVTRLVIVVVVIFAASWLPAQVVFLAQHCAHAGNELGIIAFKIAANCLSYMNSCVNPILYAFLSEPFRKNFRRLLFCRLCGTLFQSGGANAVELAALGRPSRNAPGASAIDGTARHQPMTATPAVIYQQDDVAVDLEDNAAA